MDQSQRPADRRYRPVRTHRQHPLFNGLIGFSVAMLGVIGFAPAANGPAFGEVTNVAPRVVAASLTFSGTDPIITGSVDAMFEALGTFVGPNSTEKQNRARIIPDAASFAAAFDEARLKIASLRTTAFNDAGAPVLAEATHAPQLPAAAPRISVAALDPAAGSAALSAIDTIAPGTPFPAALSQRLAYARADAPVTDFSITRDASGKQVSEKELWCLSTAIYFEARGESYRGQVGVAQVVLNRVKHKLYPSTICGVVFQNQHMRNACQFSFACDGIPERVTDAKSWKQAEEIARGAVSQSLYLPEVGVSTHYHATYVYPHWAPKMKKNTKIGLHVFYQFKRGWRFG